MSFLNIFENPDKTVYECVIGDDESLLKESLASMTVKFKEARGFPMSHVQYSVYNNQGLEFSIDHDFVHLILGVGVSIQEEILTVLFHRVVNKLKIIDGRSYFNTDNAIIPKFYEAKTFFNSSEQIEDEVMCSTYVIACMVEILCFANKGFSLSGTTLVRQFVDINHMNYIEFFASKLPEILPKVSVNEIIELINGNSIEEVAGFFQKLAQNPNLIERVSEDNKFYGIITKIKDQIKPNSRINTDNNKNRHV